MLSGRPPVRLGWIVLVVLALTVIASVAWFTYYPEEFKTLSDRVWHYEATVETLAVFINDTETAIRPGDTLNVHPDDRISIAEFKSNRPMNLKLRLYSPDLDVYRLNEPIRFSEVFKDGDFLQGHSLTIQVKEDLKVVAEFVVLGKFTALDLIAQADAAEKSDDKIVLYRQAFSMDPDSEIIKRKLVALLEKTENYKVAAAIHEELIKAQPDAESLKKLLAIYRGAMDYRKLVSTYHQLIKISTPNEAKSYLYQLAQLQEELRQYKEAIETLETLKRKLTKEARVDILAKLGYLYVQTGRPDKAILAYEDAAAINPSDANLFHNLAGLYQAKGNMEKYRRSLARGLMADPMDHEKRLTLARAHYSEGQLDKAEKVYRDLLKANPENIPARLELIKVLEDNGQVGPQIDEYEQLLLIDPGNKVIRYNLGVLYFQVADYKASAHQMETLLNLEPDDVSAKQHLFEVYLKQEKDKDAFGLAKELTRLSPDYEPAYQHAFDYLDSRKFYPSLISLAKVWVKQRPKEIRFHEYLAYAHIKQDDFDQAAVDFENILGLSPKDTDVMLKLAKIYEGTEQNAKALKMYNRLLKQNPNHPEAEKAYLRLRLERIKTKSEESD